MADGLGTIRQKTEDTRHEKLAVIRSLFGDDAANRLGGGLRPATNLTHVPADQDRIAWQKNRLIQHLRSNGKAAATEGQLLSPKTKPSSQQIPCQQQAKSMLPREALTLVTHAAPHTDLSGEHPAVIAHILKSRDQSDRVAVLRALPGRTARAVMNRLRDG